MLHLQQCFTVEESPAPSQKPTTKDIKDAISNKLEDVKDKVEFFLETLKNVKNSAVKSTGGTAKVSPKILLL